MQIMSAVIAAVFHIFAVLYVEATSHSSKESHPIGDLVSSHENYVTDGYYGIMENGSCSNTWFYPKHYDNGSTVCECGSDLGSIIECDKASGQVKLFRYYCMTYDNSNTSLIVGKCYFQCFSACGLHTQLHNLPSDPSQLEQHCGQYGRTGQLCGKCKDGFAPAAYSYNLSCVECTDYSYNWAKYTAAAFLPLTLFLFIVIIFRVSVTSGLLDVFLVFSQFISSPTLLRVLTFNRAVSIHPQVKFSAYAIVSLCGIWNLDFFRLLYPTFCMHPSMTTLQVLVLDYAIAVYPLLLIVITYSLIELHDHNFRLIVWLWKPFHYYFVCLRREWNIKNSVIHAFCTFLLLSYVKFLSVSFDLLGAVHVFNIHGETTKQSYLFFDGTVQYFGREHLPFGILALVVLLIFNIVPLVLLFLYPWRCFQRCLNHFRIECQTLRTFMDVFQGCYKNSTSGKRDCRWFAAFYLMIRIALLVIFTTVFDFAFIMITVLILLLFYLTAVFQPYKSPIHNAVNQFSLFISCLICALASNLAYSETLQYKMFINALFSVCIIILLLLYIGLLLHKCFGRRSCTQRVYQKIHALMSCRVCRRAVRSVSEESLPDRMIHVEQYAA